MTKKHVINTGLYRIEYNPKSDYPFHLALELEDGGHEGWKIISKDVPENMALSFISYALERIGEDKKNYPSYNSMHELFINWLWSTENKKNATSKSELETALIEYCYELTWHFGRLYHIGDVEKIKAAVSEKFELPEEAIPQFLGGKITSLESLRQQVAHIPAININVTDDKQAKDVLKSVENILVAHSKLKNAVESDVSHTNVGDIHIGDGSLNALIKINRAIGLLEGVLEAIITTRSSSSQLNIEGLEKTVKEAAELLSVFRQ